MTFSQVRQYVTGLLAASFTNKAELDKIGEDQQGHLTYDGNPVGGDTEIITPQEMAAAIAEDVDWDQPAQEDEEEPSNDDGE